MGPCKSVTDYLKGRLSLTDFQIDLFAKRYPAVMHVKVSKLKEIIDFLYTEGFTAYQIYQTPRILCHSLLTIQASTFPIPAYIYTSVEQFYYYYYL